MIAGKARPIALPAPDSEETGTRSPENCEVGINAIIAVANTAAT